MKKLINKIVWWFSNKCTICGTKKIEWRNADACPYHDLTPPFKQQPPRIAEQQYNLLKLKKLQQLKDEKVKK